MLQYLRETMGKEIRNAVIVSPDAGGAKRSVLIPSHRSCLVHVSQALHLIACLSREAEPGLTLKTHSHHSASSMAASLDLDFALFHKERKKANEIARMVLVGNVEGKTAILIDDMADTCGTLALAAKHLLANGAKTVLALVTHGILSGKAMQVLNESEIEKLIVTNSIPQAVRASATPGLTGSPFPCCCPSTGPGS